MRRASPGFAGALTRVRTSEALHQLNLYCVNTNYLNSKSTRIPLANCRRLLTACTLFDIFSRHWKLTSSNPVKYSDAISLVYNSLPGNEAGLKLDELTSERTSHLRNSHMGVTLLTKFVYPALWPRMSIHTLIKILGMKLKWTLLTSRHENSSNYYESSMGGSHNG